MVVEKLSIFSDYHLMFNLLFLVSFIWVDGDNEGSQVMTFGTLDSVPLNSIKNDNSAGTVSPKEFRTFSWYPGIIHL